jgi:CBS domain containing-hemolysin-like protein
MTYQRDRLAVSEGTAPRSPNLMDRLRALFGLGSASIRDDIEDALAEASTDADLSPQELAMLKNVLALHDVRVEDIMVPRADIIAVPVDTKVIDVLAQFRTAGHSRLPAYGETLDDPRGMVHIRDLVAFLATEANESADGRSKSLSLKERFPNLGKLDLALSEVGILRPVLFVPPSMPALDLLVKMQAKRTHMALVIDEYGGTDGLASIEDIMEMIVGDIEDEHDLDESPRIDALADGSFIVDARADLDDVSTAIALDLTAISDAEEVDTLGGLITTLAGHVPAKGELIPAGGLEFEVLDADPRRVKRIKILPRAPGPNEAGDEA